MNESLEIQSIDGFSKSFQSLLKTSQQLLKSNMLPEGYKTPEQIAFVILKGRELNLPATTAITGLYPVGRQVGMYGWLMLALVKRSGLLEGGIQFKEEDGSCTCIMKRKSEETFSFTFTRKDAHGLKLDSKTGSQYLTQEKTMLRWRSISGCIRIVFPDIIGGMYLVDELDPSKFVEADTSLEESDYKKDPTQIYTNALEALEKIIKFNNTIEAFENWKNLYKEDINSIPENMQGVLKRRFSEVIIKLNPDYFKEVKDVSTTISGGESTKEITQQSSVPTP